MLIVARGNKKKCRRCESRADYTGNLVRTVYCRVIDGNFLINVKIRPRTRSMLRCSFQVRPQTCIYTGVDGVL